MVNDLATLERRQQERIKCLNDLAALISERQREIDNIRSLTNGQTQMLQLVRVVV